MPLARDGMGARSLRLMLYRVDGEVTAIDIGLAMPTRNATHVSRLIGLKLEGVTKRDADLECGFGFETLGLSVTVAERMGERQMEMGAVADTSEESCAALLDSLRQRLGTGRVRRLRAVASHLPERAETSVAATNGVPWPASDGS